MMRAALCVWILSAVVCVGRGDHHVGHAMGGQDTAVDGSDSSVSLLTSANQDFAFRLYKKLVAHADSQGKNIFFSPASVSVALAALSVGARGETHRQLFGGLGFNNSQLTQENVDRAFHTLLEKSVTNEDTNADSANTINKYVSDKTNGKIEKLVESLDPNTVMYLISYIYFKGKWENPFDAELTKEDIFNVNENTKVPVQMMNMEDSFDIYYDQAINTSVLHLPFNGSYSMLLVLPDDMTVLENVICPAHVTKWLKWMKSRRYDIFVPKFSIKSSYTLNDVLIQMGMTDMFGDRADLSGISAGQKLAVSDVVHQATLDVDEAGATAAAATGIGITLMSFQHIPVLKFNRPFMAVITERATNEILFMGKIINPTI
uniref:Thyroxine-binding globulin n=1 Tax=Amphiprion ocellaris TaxID=80972 RepID=A0AAQ5XF73_AMPOC